jgi:hypothetical protein
MPAIFGAFGNFLLPTQLGVHDVAFPRLNSAAFWFLPGGLIMLCQLVCVDRRYQRMNCFNIRELQGILKRKFFTDLVNTSDSHKAVESTLINMRHKNNMSNILLYDQSLFYNFDLTNTSKFKNFTFNPGKVYTYSTTNILSQDTSFIKSLNLNLTNNLLKSLVNVLKDFTSFITLPTTTSFVTLLNSLFFIKTTIINSLCLYTPNLMFLYNQITQINTSVSTNNTSYQENNNLSYNSSTLNYSNFTNLVSSSFAENSST